METRVWRWLTRTYLPFPLQEERWRPEFEEGDDAPKIPLWQWRVGSQWVALNRAHALLIAQDDSVHERFARVCRFETVVLEKSSNPDVLM